MVKYICCAAIKFIVYHLYLWYTESEQNMNNAEIIKEVLKLLNSINLSPEDLQDVQKNGPSGKREYKDSLFVYLFGNEKYKNLTLELYNAINKTHYTNPDEVEITTLENVVYINVKNDISFLLSGMMNFYEHQSTYNPNIPVRMLIYSAKVYDRLIHEKKYNIYGQKKFELPAPKCVCFFNGTKNMADRTVMKLSDSFSGDDKGDIEVSVTFLNINAGHNKEMMNASKALEDYAEFVGNVKKNGRTSENLKEAIDKAIDALPEDSVVGTILKNNRSEVVSMCLEEYTQEYADKLHKYELEEANKRTEEANKRTEEANKRTEEANTRANAAEKKAEELKIKLKEELLKNGYSLEKINELISETV